ncbi:hypothetical protein [Desulfonatronospira sp.]|nr:hypothetical protein [Desulfonatronospira sp.]
MHLVQEQRLTVFFPRGKTIKSKFYILSNEEMHRCWKQRRMLAERREPQK